MYRKNNNNVIPILKKFCFLFASCLIIPLTLFVFPVHSGDFKLIKDDSHYEPKLTLSEYAYRGIILPDTNIKVGSYEYIADNGKEVGRLGFLIDNKRFYYVKSDEYNLCGGGFNYSVYNGYLIVDSSGYCSAVGANHLMFLFKYDKNTVHLLDVIGQAYIGTYGMDFSLKGDEKRGKYWRKDIKDIDQDGKPEIGLRVIIGHHSEPPFMLYLEIANDYVQVDFNPELYKPLFEEENKKTKSIRYYIYGFLSKKIELQKIKSILKADKNKYQLIVSLLENIENWDAAFHNVNGEKFVLMQYNIERR